MSEKYSIVKGGDVNYWIRMNGKIRFQTVGADDEQNAKLLVKALIAYELLPSVVEALEESRAIAYENGHTKTGNNLESLIAKLKGLS